MQTWAADIACRRLGSAGIEPVLVAIKPAAFRLEGFDQVPQVADAFQSGAVVDLRLDGAPDSEARRVLDFGSGLVYAAGGAIEKLGPQRFRLVPSTPQAPAAGSSGDREPRTPWPPLGSGVVTLLLSTPTD